MSASPREEPRARGALANRPLTLSGLLLLVGFVVNGIQRMLLHPTGAEDDHGAIFREYADSGVWGSAAVVSRLVPTWLGLLLGFAGLLSLAVGISVAYAGLESGFQDAVGIALQLVFLVFIVGLLVVGRRAREPGTRVAST